MKFHISAGSGRCTVSIPERFDENNALSIRQACHERLQSDDIDHLRVDLSRVEFINSSGLGALVWLRSNAAVMSKTMALANPHPKTRDVLELANFHRLFDIHYAQPA